ncbi:MAG: methionyl-tRNA formyltransferase, partial [Proteobacteria bacterium]|nr:methionyl-tRNA formyltransferase [Pseudomonadota bacterium]
GGRSARSWTCFRHKPAFAETVREFGADLGIVVAFGQFLPKRVRELPRLGYLINAHASLLPRHRGAAPIAHAILAGDLETGVSVMRVEREMDAGPSSVVRRTPIAAGETTGELTERLAALAADAIAEAIDLVAQGRIVWTPQNDARATLAPKLGPADALLDWREAAVALARRVRALAPRPGAFTTLQNERLRILAATALAVRCDDAPGTLRLGGDAPLRIATGEGWLAPRVLQRAGGKPLDVDVFLRGHPLADGARVGG